MPLISAAYIACAAGLFLGFGGFVFPAGALVLGGLAWAGFRRSTVAASLSLLLAAGATAGSLSGRDDDRCARDIAARGMARVRLAGDVRLRQPARGVAVSPHCRVVVRVRAVSGSASSGARVLVRGEARREGRQVTFLSATVTPDVAPGFLPRWRARTGRVIDELYGSQAPLARALILADEHDIAPDVRRAFADAGIIHMLSVSGLHVAVLAEAVVLMLLACGLGIRRAEAVAVVVTISFVLFVGAPSPAVRAGGMYCAVVASRWLQRPTSPWAILALGAAPPLVDSRAVLDVGYQLSVAGMSGLIASGALSRRLPRPAMPAWMARGGRELLAAMVTSAVTAPIVAWNFGRLSLAAPLTNLAAAPLFGLAQPALFLSMVAAPLKPLARLIADGTRLPLLGIEAIARWGSAIPGAAMDIMPSAPTALLLAAAASALVAGCTARRWFRPVMLGGAAIAAAVWWPIVAPGTGHVELHVIDVGQGDAVALRTPVGRWILVDAGAAWQHGDAGARIVAPYVSRRGGDVAALVLSHPHSDHIGGVSSLLRLLRVSAVYDGGVVYASDVYDDLLTGERRRAVPWRLARAGDTLNIDGVRLQFLGPDSLTAERATDPNEASVVVLAEFRGVRFLLTGDAEHDEEERMVERFGDAMRADVLKVGHHGSSTSSSDAFLAAVEPRVAVVSVGVGNHYGHPSAEVLRAFAERQVQVLRTDEDGSVVVSTDGSVLHVRTGDGAWELRARRAHRALR